MRIVCEEQKKYLETKPELFAVIRRRKYYEIDQRVIIHVNDNIYHGVISDIVSLFYAYKYLKYSGFRTTNDWFKCALNGERNLLMFRNETNRSAVLLIKMEYRK